MRALLISTSRSLIIITLEKSQDGQQKHNTELLLSLMILKEQFLTKNYFLPQNDGMEKKCICPYISPSITHDLTCKLCLVRRK